MYIQLAHILKAFANSPEAGWESLVEAEAQRGRPEKLVPVNTPWEAWAGIKGLWNILVAAAQRWEQPPYTVGNSILQERITERLEEATPLLDHLDPTQLQAQLLACAELAENHNWLLGLWTGSPNEALRQQATSPLGTKLKPTLHTPGHRLFLHEFATRQEWQRKPIQPQNWEWLTNDTALVSALANEKNAGGKTAAEEALSTQNQAGLAALAAVHPQLWHSISPREKQRHPGWDQLAKLVRGQITEPAELYNELHQWKQKQRNAGTFAVLGLTNEKIGRTMRAPAWTWPEEETPAEIRIGAWITITPNTIRVGKSSQKTNMIGLRIAPNTAIVLTKGNNTAKLLEYWLQSRGVQTIKLFEPGHQEPDPSKLRLRVLEYVWKADSKIRKNILDHWDSQYLDDTARKYIEAKTKALEIEQNAAGQNEEAAREVRCIQQHIPHYQPEMPTLAAMM